MPQKVSFGAKVSCRLYIESHSGVIYEPLTCPTRLLIWMAIIDGSGRYIPYCSKNDHIYLSTTFHYHSNSTSTLEEELANWVTFIDVQKENNNNNNNIMAPTTKTAYVTGQYCTLTVDTGRHPWIYLERVSESIVEKKNKNKNITTS